MVGLEPTPSNEVQILNLVRLPFRHIHSTLIPFFFLLIIGKRILLFFSKKNVFSASFFDLWEKR